MTTVLAVYSSDGCEGRCDARCHGAMSPECDCVCGGMNHGVGLDRAVENTRQLFDEMVRTFTEKHSIQEYKVELGQEVVQLSLFSGVL